MDFLRETWGWMLALWQEGWSTSFPIFVTLEVALNGLVLIGVYKWWVRRKFVRNAESSSHHPGISCLVTCYSEGEAVALTLRSLAMQIYRGPIEIIPIVDGSIRNKETWDAVIAQQEFVDSRPNRKLVPIGKPMRGGRVSSLNSGLARAKYDYIMVFDGDTSFTNDTVRLCARHFADPNCVAVSGNLRIRNRKKSLATRMQALEYNLGIALGRTGLAEWGIVNNISGAFGCFRKDFLKHIGGWDTGTAEDLDLTTRIKAYFGRYPQYHIAFEPFAIGFTDGPEDFWTLIRQRDRWDGDLVYLYLRKYPKSFSPRILGWRNFALYVVVGLLFQMAVPFLVWFYYINMFILYPPALVVATSAFVFVGYFLMGLVMWFVYMLLLSRFPKEDIKAFPLLVMQPFYSFALRVLMVPYVLKSFLFSGHLDSAMAPYWVLRKGRF